MASLLAVIAIPLVGWFFQNWSGATTLIVYWFETVAASVFITARILFHRRWAPRRGHFTYAAPSQQRRGTGSSTFLAGFVVTMVVFCAAHALFLGFILFMLNRNGQSELAVVDWRSVGFGCLSVFGFLALDFLVDLVSLRRWSFFQIEQTANLGLSRVMVVHLTLIFGLFAAAFTGAPDALFGVFVVLKTLASLSSALPQWDPEVAPGWMSRVMNRLPNAHPGKRFEDKWAADRADENARRTRNEQPWPA